MTRSILDIRQAYAVYVAQPDPHMTMCRQDVVTLLAEVDRLTAALGEVVVMQRSAAFSLVERALRKHELSVCKYEDDGYYSVWEGEAQDGWSLLQAVDGLRKESP